jgi:hypothetical protein
VLLAAGTSLFAACGSTSKPQVHQGKTSVQGDWQAFFSGATSADRKTALVQDGAAFAKVIDEQSKSPLAKSVAATVSKVIQNTPDKAVVTYSVTLGGKPVLTNVKGEAVLIGGVWKVGAQSFCELLTLEQVKPPVCSGVK